jgi:hypothetical protein
MIVLLPTKGVSGCLDVAGGGASRFMSLGPFPSGNVLRRVTATAAMQGEAGGPELRFQVAVVGSATGSDAVFAAGVPLLSFGNKLISGAPCVSVVMDSSGSARYEFFPGWEFQTGAQWLLVRATLVNVGSVVSLFVSAEVWRVVRVGELTARIGVAS